MVANGSRDLLVDPAPGRVFDIAYLTEQCNCKRRLQRIVQRGVTGLFWIGTNTWNVPVVFSGLSLQLCDFREYVVR